MPDDEDHRADQEAEEEQGDRANLLPDGVASRNRLPFFTPRRLFIGVGAVAVVGLIIAIRGSLKTSVLRNSCDTVQEGYQCNARISHHWGQYSPYFAVQSEIADELPKGCEITFAQVLSRHGARYPTGSKSAAYAQTIEQIHCAISVESLKGKYSFLADYNYNLGADHLTTFGRQQMIDSGIKFYNRYKKITTDESEPFIRAASSQRVVESAELFSQGFHAARLDHGRKDASYPYSIITIREGPGSNNSLNHGLCKEFENQHHVGFADSAEAVWARIFIPPIQARLNRDLPRANLSLSQTIFMMDLCPFNTVAAQAGRTSRFCDLFTETEWQQYGYFQSLNKYYGFSHGSPLGPTQGVGFANELIARMTNSPVKDNTSTNYTLDHDSATFPYGKSHVLYADFSHDNDMTAHFSALGLYNDTYPLSKVSMSTRADTDGYSAAWTVPFAARVYFEKMRCKGEDEELVRVLVNDRVQPLRHCVGDSLGRCKLSVWIESLGFAKQGGHWDECF